MGGIAKPEETRAVWQTRIRRRGIIARPADRHGVLDRCPGDPLLLEVRFGKLRLIESGDAESLRHQMMTKIPGIQLGGRPASRHNVPLRLRRSSQSGAWRTDAVEKTLKTDIQGFSAEIKSCFCRSCRQFNEKARST